MDSSTSTAAATASASSDDSKPAKRLPSIQGGGGKRRKPTTATSAIRVIPIPDSAKPPIIEYYIKCFFGRDINAKNPKNSGSTPLMEAAINNDIASAFMLLEAWPRFMNFDCGDTKTTKKELKVDIDTKDENEDSALILAIENGNFDVATMIIDNGADINQAGGGGLTPLHYACGDTSECDDFDNFPEPKQVRICSQFVKLLLEKGANADVFDVEGNTPLQYAVRHEYDGIIGLIIEKMGGDNIDMVNRYEKTALFNACYYGNFEIVKLLLKHGANIEGGGSGGYTPLHAACQQLKSEYIVGFLIENGSNIDASDMYCGRTALHHICEMRPNDRYGEPSRIRIKILKVLIEKGASIDHADRRGVTPLCEALSDPEGGFALGKVLVDSGAQVNIACNEGMTPLHWVCHTGCCEAAEFLLNKGAKVDSTDLYGRTPLHCLGDGRFSSNQDKISDLLLAKGTNIDVTDNYGRTALHCACAKAGEKFAKHLIDKGAKVDMTDNKGRSPLHYAYAYRRGLVTFLISKGADIRRKDKNGLAPPDIERFSSDEHESEPEDSDSEWLN